MNQNLQNDEKNDRLNPEQHKSLNSGSDENSLDDVKKPNKVRRRVKVRKRVRIKKKPNSKKKLKKFGEKAF